LRRIDSCITQVKAQGPSRTCNESKEEEEVDIGNPPSGARGERRPRYHGGGVRSKRGSKRERERALPFSSPPCTHAVWLATSRCAACATSRCASTAPRTPRRTCCPYASSARCPDRRCLRPELTGRFPVEHSMVCNISSRPATWRSRGEATPLPSRFEQRERVLD